MKKTVGSEITYFHYDYNGNLISETDGTGSPVRDYIYLNGEPVAMKLYGTGAGWYYFLNDHLGTPQKVTDASGTVVWEAGYMPFGEARILIADIENNLRFPGQYYDKETGLHYNYHRYYDPDTGRYLTPDPIGLEGGINLYAYVDGNPVNFIDPYGLIVGVDDITVIALVGASAATMAYVNSPEGQRALNQIADNIWSMMSGGDSSGGTCNISGESTPGMPNDPDRDPAKDKKLSKGEIKKLKEGGYDAHDLKPENQGSRYDLFKDRQGNIYVKPKSGVGPGDPTGININNF